jgi:hypothetical protein
MVDHAEYGGQWETIPEMDILEYRHLIASSTKIMEITDLITTVRPTNVNSFHVQDDRWTQWTNLEVDEDAEQPSKVYPCQGCSTHVKMHKL